MPNIMDGYKQRDIYNVDESGLFIISCLQELSLLKVTIAMVERILKIASLIYFVQTLSTDSDKRTPIVVGKSRNPRCFNSVKTMPLYYEASTKAWITATIFTE